MIPKHISHAELRGTNSAPLPLITGVKIIIILKYGLLSRNKHQHNKSFSKEDYVQDLFSAISPITNTSTSRGVYVFT